jgi:C-terminal processing protease CtpA/Prc
MLAERITINNEYDIYLPVSEYYTAEGRSLNKMGIEPDVKVSGEDGMKYVLKTF